MFLPVSFSGNVLYIKDVSLLSLLIEILLNASAVPFFNIVLWTSLDPSLVVQGHHSQETEQSCTNMQIVLCTTSGDEPSLEVSPVFIVTCPGFW